MGSLASRPAATRHKGCGQHCCQSGSEHTGLHTHKHTHTHTHAHTRTHTHTETHTHTHTHRLMSHTCTPLICMQTLPPNCTIRLEVQVLPHQGHSVTADSRTGVQTVVDEDGNLFTVAEGNMGRRERREGESGSVW